MQITVADSGAEHLQLGFAPADLKKDTEQEAYVEQDLLKTQPHFGLYDTLQSHKLKTNTIFIDWKGRPQLMVRHFRDGWFGNAC